MLVGWDWASETHDVTVIDRAKQVYDNAHTSGKRHPHAVRILARAWLRVIFACYRDATRYDPEIHTNNHKIKQAADGVLAA